MNRVYSHSLSRVSIDQSDHFPKFSDKNHAIHEINADKTKHVFKYLKSKSEYFGRYLDTVSVLLVAVVFFKYKLCSEDLRAIKIRIRYETYVNALYPYKVPGM